MNSVRSIDRAVDILEAMARQGGMTLSQAAGHLKAPKSTTLNILRTLVRRGLCDLDQATRTYRLGPLLQELLLQSRAWPELRAIARPHLEEVARRTGESVFLSVPDGNEITYVDVVESQHPIRYAAGVGARRPLHCSAVGKLSLALLPRTVLQRYVREVGLRRYTPNTVTDLTRLRRELEATARRGYAVSTGEFISDLMAVAAPVFGPSQRYIAAVNVAGPIFRLQKRTEEFTEILKHAAGAISNEVRQFPRALLVSPVNAGDGEGPGAITQQRSSERRPK